MIVIDLANFVEFGGGLFGCSQSSVYCQLYIRVVIMKLYIALRMKF